MRALALALAAVLLGVAVAVAPADYKEQFSMEVPGYDDSFANEKEFDSMDRATLTSAAKKMTATFGICTLTGKRLRQQCHLTGPKPKSGMDFDADHWGQSDHELGEGMSTGTKESAWAQAHSMFNMVSRRDEPGNGVSGGSTKLDRMKHSELIHFCKKATEANAMCQKGLQSMKAECKKVAAEKKMYADLHKDDAHGPDHPDDPPYPSHAHADPPYDPNGGYGGMNGAGGYQGEQQQADQMAQQGYGTHASNTYEYGDDANSGADTQQNGYGQPGFHDSSGGYGK